MTRPARRQAAAAAPASATGTSTQSVSKVENPSTEISVLGFSTFDTDWVLVPSAVVQDAAAAWRRAGLVVTPASLTGGTA